MSSKQEHICISCSAPLTEAWETFVLIPSKDVPLAGSRTEVLLTPAACRRVRACSCTQCGFVTIRQATPTQ
jgi:hypothetical protein